MEELNQLSPGAWAFLGTVFITISGGFGYLVRRLSERRVEKENAEAKRRAEASAQEAARAKEDARVAAELRDRIIEAAEKRESLATERTDRAIDGLAKLTDVVQELLVINRSLSDRFDRLLEEVRRAAGDRR